MPQEMSLVAFNNTIAKYSKTHHIEVEGVKINRNAGTVKIDKLVLIPLESYEYIKA